MVELIAHTGRGGMVFSYDDIAFLWLTRFHSPHLAATSIHQGMCYLPAFGLIPPQTVYGAVNTIQLNSWPLNYLIYLSTKHVVFVSLKVAKH